MQDFAELHRQVAFGEAGGKIIWQPRIGCWFIDKLFDGETLPAPWEDVRLPPGYRDYTAEDLGKAFNELVHTALVRIYRDLNCSARIYYYNSAFRAVEDERVKMETRSIGNTDTETRVETPVGRQSWITRRMESSYAARFVKRPVESEGEMRVAAWRAERTTWRWDQKAFDRVHECWGDLGAPTMYMPRMTVQDLYINSMGTQKGIYALYDWSDTVDAYFEALNCSHDHLIDVVNACPIDIINFGENIHAGTLPPNLFEEYHLPECRRRCDRLHAGGKFVSSHWDGDTKPLLPLARETHLDGIEAITPAPQGDVTLEEIKEGLGDDMFLLDGLPAVYFDHTFPVSLLKETAHRLIELFAPKLILGISDEISSTGDIDRVRIVGDIVARYNALH